MSGPGEVFRLPDGTRFCVLESTQDSGGRVVRIEMTVPPGGPAPPAHIHPYHEEEFLTVSGRLTLFLNGSWMESPAGQTKIIPVGAAHTYRNRSVEPVTFITTHRPAMQFEAYVMALYRLALDYGLSDMRTPKALPLVARVWLEFGDTIRPAGMVLPVLMSLLAPLAAFIPKAGR